MLRYVRKSPVVVRRRKSLFAETDDRSYVSNYLDVAYSADVLSAKIQVANAQDLSMMVSCFITQKLVTFINKNNNIIIT